MGPSRNFYGLATLPSVPGKLPRDASGRRVSALSEASREWTTSPCGVFRSHLILCRCTCERCCFFSPWGWRGAQQTHLLRVKDRLRDSSAKGRTSMTRVSVTWIPAPAASWPEKEVKVTKQLTARPRGDPGLLPGSCLAPGSHASSGGRAIYKTERAAAATVCSGGSALHVSEGEPHCR